MSSVALPSRLVAPPRVSGDDRLKSTSVALNPSNASGATAFSPTNNSRIVFNIPAYSKSFINPKRSYLSFTITKSGVGNVSKVINGCPWVDRMTLRAGSQMVEDIQDYNTLERAMAQFEGVDFAESRGHLVGDYTEAVRKQVANVADATVLIAKAQALQAAGRTYTKPLMSGVIGKNQEFYVPIGLFEGSGAHALQMELYLAKDDQVVQSDATGAGGTPTYSLTNVQLHLEVVQLPERAMSAFNDAVMSGGMVSLPYSTSRVFRQYVPSAQTAIDMAITESAKNVERVVVALRKQSSLSGYTETTVYEGEADNFDLLGGSTSACPVSQYQFRYGTEQFPPSPVENLGGSLPTVLQALSSMDMLDKAVRLTSMNRTGEAVFEANGFLIGQGFKTSEDAIENGLNTASSGAPVELKLKFASNSENLALFAFVQSSYSLNIKTGGNVSMVDGRMA
jgi:hypothetical protein